jgi:hypothetical protein
MMDGVVGLVYFGKDSQVNAVSASPPVGVQSDTRTPDTYHLFQGGRLPTHEESTKQLKL